MLPLNTAALSRLPAAVAVPTYDRSAVRPGVVHLGVGAFHRAHQASYFDRLLTLGHLEWGICGVGTRQGDVAVRNALAPQDYLYTLLTRDPDGATHARVVGSLIGYRFVPEDSDGILRTLTSPTTRIVSLTITEGGYDAAAGGSREHDVFGYLAEALRQRRDDGIAPFTVMSCDNIEHNGTVARNTVIAAADRVDTTLSAWIDRNVAFPNSMVDRITPATTPEVRAVVRADYGIDDAWPIQSESFIQWVIEDQFSCGRPPLQEVGISIVGDVAPHELMKLRLLNASHQMMSYLGLLAGFRYVHDVMADEDLGQFVMSYLRTEAAPTLPPVPGIEVGRYIDQLGQRFSSRAISDTLDRQIVDGSVRIPKFVLPVIRDRLAADAPVTHAALTLAAWCAAYESPKLTMVDRAGDELRRLSWADRDDPGAFLRNPDVFGELVSNPRLHAAYRQAKRNLRELGPRGAIRAARLSQRALGADRV